MRFLVLGPLEVWDQDRLCPLYSERERKVLSMLLSGANRPITRSRLIAAMWEDPPATARRQLHNCLSHLRRQLGSVAGAQRSLIVTTTDGYQINLQKGQCDEQIFRDLVAYARQYHAQGRLSEAVQRFREALGLWRGQALEDMHGTLIESWAAKLDEDRASATEQCMEVELALGHHQVLTGELGELVAAYPLRERLVGQLMTALFRSGRQADALHAYQQMVSRLDELGIHPTPQLQQLQVAILRNDQQLGRPTTAIRRTAVTSGATAVHSLENMEAMFQRLRQLGQISSPTIVLPMLTAHLQTLCAMAQLGEPEQRPATLRLASRYAEFAGWMAQEAGDDPACQRWTSYAVRLARAGEDEQLPWFALVRGADLALYDDDPVSMLMLAQKIDPSRASTRVRGVAAQRLAQGYALIGDYSGYRRAVALAAELVESEPQACPGLGSTHLPDPVAITEGWSLVDLGRPAEAATVLEREVSRIPATALRTRARYGARLLLAHEAAGNLDRVRAHSGDVLNDAGLVDSATIRKDLRRLRLRLARHGCSGLDDVYDHLTEVIARRPAEPPAPFDFDDSW